MGRNLRVWTVRVLKWLGLGLLALLVIGAASQQIGLLLDSSFAPPAAEMIQVRGRAVHLACSGAGPRTFLLDAGAGAGTFEWLKVAPLLAKAGRVCAFDRAGLGWSEDDGGAADAAAAADRLSTLVRTAKIPTPFVYVGHSLGANFGIVYAAKHSTDVSALVLIEPGVPVDLLEDFHGTRAEAMAQNDCDWTCRAAQLATFFGLPRLAGFAIGHKTLDEHTRSYYLAFLAQPATAKTIVASLNAAVKTAYQDSDVHSFADLPVLTIASAEPRQPDSGETWQQVEKWKARQRAWFASVARMSRHGKGPVVIPDSNHASMVVGNRQSKILAREILSFLSTNSARPQ
jgi:pimeloyl-ACP methyl ester carboxylesterase